MVACKHFEPLLATVGFTCDLGTRERSKSLPKLLIFTQPNCFMWGGALGMFYWFRVSGKG